MFDEEKRRTGKLVGSGAGTCVLLWHEQVRGQVGVWSLVTRAELETPHVTDHRCGIKGLLQRENTHACTQM